MGISLPDLTSRRFIFYGIKYFAIIISLPRSARMKQFKSPIILSVLYLLVNTGCKKTEVQQFTQGFNVYMAGTVNGTGVYWKNGQGTQLAPGFNATCIAVSGTEVFVGGQSNDEAVYWKDGHIISLAQPSSIVNGIALSGSDVYCVGSAAGTLFIDSAGGSDVNITSAVYWKNGVANNLEPNARGAAAEAICFSGTDMYVVGHVYNDADTAVQWKNGVRMDYTDNNFQNQVAYAVALLGTDVYAPGIYNNNPVYWKNGIKTALAIGSAGLGAATSIAINGTDTYIAGSYYSQTNGPTAAFWKNGVLITLPNDQSYPSNATGIAVAGSDVYVTGSVSAANGGAPIPAYWKNGVEVDFSGNGTVNAICVSTQ